MDLEQRLNHLESHHDWQGTVELLEQAIASSDEAVVKAACHLRLGRLLHTRFLQGVRALKHFQDAFKLNPQLSEALVEARGIYWQLGKFNMVQKLLELQLKSATGEAAIALLKELGDVLTDVGDHDGATSAYAKAQQASGGNEELAQLLADSQASEEDWQERIARILRAAHEQEDAASRSQAFLRAARLARRFAPSEVEGMLHQAYVTEPSNGVVASLYEGLLVDEDRAATIYETQQTALAALTDREQKASAAAHFGARWALRHQNPDMAMQFLEAALECAPGYEPGFAFAVEVYGTRDGDWDRVLELASNLAERATLPEVGFYLATSGMIAWRQQGDLIKARPFFEALKTGAPEHPAVLAFEAQIGEPLAVESKPEPAQSVRQSAAPSAAAAKPEPSREPPAAKTSSEASPAVSAADDEAHAPVTSAEAERPEASVEAAPDEAVVQDEGAVAELRQQLAQQEAGKRYHEYVRTLVALADAVSDPQEKVELYSQAADLYVNKFVNQAEAVRTYEQILTIAPTDPNANQFLLEMYEKRRDWEKLIALSVAQANRLDAGPERTEAYRAIAQLATERVKKPDVCIGLWQVVLEAEPDDSDALAALSQMYERARDFEKLADVLERVAESTYDTTEKIGVLTKLGQIVGDRLKDDARAVEAYRTLLTLNPDDRRAQEQLKRRYIALGRWDDLEVFYAENEKWDEFIRVLESNESRADSVEQRINMLVKVAELWMTQKGKPERAARAYEKILNLDPANQEAAERLIPIYATANNPRGLAGAIEVKLGHAADAAERVELLREVAGLYETRLHDKTKAFERFLAAFELAPGDELAQQDVERATKAVGDWQALVVAYREAIAGAVEPQTEASLRLRLGRTLIDELGKVDDALGEYRAVLEAEPTNIEALGALEQLYRQAERWEDLLGVFKTKEQLAELPEERKPILFEIAAVQEQQLGQLSEAVATYQLVLEEDPTEVQALRALDALYRETETWEPYADVLTRLIELDSSPEALVDLKFRLANVQRTELGDPSAALENYREILFLDPDHVGACGALEGLLSVPALRGDVAETLEAIYESREDWAKLIEVLEILASTEEELARSVELLRKTATVAAERLNSLDKAVEAQARAVVVDPAATECRIELEHYIEQSGAWPRLIEIYGQVAAGSDDPVLARDYWMRLAAIEERLEHVLEASAAYEKVLELEPSDSEALEAMDSLYRATQHWERLIGVYRRRIELTQDGGETERLCGEMAQVYEEQLGKPEEAIAAYREVLALDPANQTALVALDGLFSRQELWSELAENLESRLSLAESDQEELELMLRLAALREQRMAEVDAAIDGYRLVLERDPVNAVALQALERLSVADEHALAIAEILEPLYRHQGDHEKLIRVYEVQVARADDVHRQVDLLHQVAELYEDAAGDLNSSFDTLARALAADPAHEGTREALDRTARATGRFNDLARVFEALAERQEDPELGSQLYTLAARVHEVEVGNTDKAIELYRKVLTIDPMSLTAAESLQALFQATESYADMSLILQRKAGILDDIDAQKEAFFEAATLEEEVLQRQENAIGVYLKILEVDPEDLRAVDALINLYLGLARWEELLGVYSKKVDLVIDPEEKKVILYQVGAVYERELGNVALAIDTYQRVLELDPDDLTALGRLDVLYQAAENWQELLSILTHEAELTADPAEAVSFQYRIAELYEKHLMDLERAVDLYREILNIQPDHVPTLQALEGIKDGQDAALSAAGVLEPVYDAMGEWQRLVSVLEVHVRFADDPFTKVDHLHRMARLYEENLVDAKSAFDVYARAVAEDSQNEESLSSLERLASLIERWPDVAQLYDTQLEKVADEPERLVELALRVAQVYEVQLERVDNAVARYRRVLDAEPDNRTALSSLDRLFSQTERWQDLAEVLHREAEVGDTADEILEYKFRVGQVYQLQLGDIDRALDAYREVLGAAPEHHQAIESLKLLFNEGTKQLQVAEILEPLYQTTGEWERLIQIHEAQLSHAQEPEDRLALYYRVAEDGEERLLDPQRAFETFVRALREYPLDERTGEELERLASMIDNGWEQLANCYADALGMEGLEPAVQAVLGKRLARVFEEELADVAKAEETYRYVLTVSEREVEALANLDRIYSSMEQWQELSGVLEQRAAVAEDEHEKVDLHSRLGQVYEEALQQPEDAIRAYRVIFDRLDPENEAAIEALGRIYEQTQQWQELASVYERELENAVGDVQEAEIRAKIAGLAAERLGKVDEAVEGWKRVLDLRGEDPEALWALADLYQRQEQWAELTDVLERHFDIAETDEDRVNILVKRALLFSEQLHRDDEALETWQRVLEIDYANVDALRAMAQVWRERNEPHELVNALHAIVDRVAEIIEATELKDVYRELGKTYGEALEQPFEASEAWQSLLGVDSGDFEAMEELEKIYRSEERWTEVIGVKRGRAEAFTEPEEKVRELLEVAELWRRDVGEYDQATADYERIVEVEPTHDGAFDALEKLHAAAERWEPLVELYLNRLDSREETSERADLLRRIARVFEEHLDDQNQAFDALVNAFAEDFGDDESVEYLERMSQATNRWGELINTANAWLQEQQDDRSKIQLCLRLGKWYGQDLGHPEYAQPYYQQIVQLDPNNVQVLRQMAAIHRMSANWQKVGETLTRALDVAVANEDRKAILVDLGELLEKNIKDVEQGIAFYKRAIEIDPLHVPALSALERIYESSGDQGALAETLQAKIKAVRDSDAVAKYTVKLGQLYESELQDLERAAQQYRAVLEVDPANLLALRGLERIDDALQDWPDLVLVLERQLDVVETERERIEALLKLADIQEQHFLKADLAAQRLEAALEIDAGEERAYVALERCYRRLKQWLDLINTLERHVAEVHESEAKVRILGQVAQVYSDEVGDVQRAIDSYQNIVELDDTNVGALEALGRLFEKQGDALQAIDAMIRVADLTTDGGQRVEMYFRIGRAQDEKLGDRVSARERFEMALDLDPTHLASLAALRTIAVDESDWDAAARYLEQEQANTEAPRARARLLVELGRLRDDMLGEHELAVQSFELAMQSDGDCEEAALPLLDEYVATERWSDAEPLAELLVRKCKARDRAEQHMLYKRLGQVHAALGNHEPALKAYQTAHHLDLTDKETIRGIADVAYELGDWPSALTNYQKVLTALGEQDVDERTSVYYRLGCIKGEQGQARQAINNFEKALALTSEHRDTLEALVEVYTRSNDWKQVAAYKRQILDGVFEADERFTLLNEIGDIWSEREKNWAKAIEALEEALELQPEDHVLLHKLLQLYQEAGDWQKMVDSLQTIAELETRPEVKSRYVFTQAQLYRDKLADEDHAVELFNEALDLNPNYLEAFERINKVLTKQRNWKQLERSYRKMLHRIAGKGNKDLEHTLWHQLGLIYRDRMEAIDSAVEAFKMASTCKPDSELEHQILAELYETAERYDDAVEEQRMLLVSDPSNVEHYRSLYRLYLYKQTYDEAWAQAAVMAFLGQADQEERQFFEDYRADGMLPVQGTLTDEHWRKFLIHQDENPFISKVFELIAPAALQAKVAQLKGQGKLPSLDPRFRQDPATSTVTFAKTFGWAGHVLGVGVPQLFVRSDVAGSILAVPAVPPASVAGQTVLSGFKPQELAFICAKHLTMYRGEHYVRNLFQTQSELTIMFFAGVMIAAPATAMPPDMAQQIRATAQELAKYMEPIQVEQLRQVVKKLIEDGLKANIKRWMQAVELTACRAGLLACGDLEIAKRVILQEPQLPGDKSPAEKMQDLLVFTSSAAYSELRRTLGLHVG